MDDVERIRGLYREYWHCMIAKDGDVTGLVEKAVEWLAAHSF